MDHGEPTVRHFDHKMSFQVVAPKSNGRYKKITGRNLKRPRFDFNDLVASEISPQKNQNHNLIRLSSNEADDVQKKILDQDYTYEYQDYPVYLENDYYNRDHELPDHIVV